MMRLREDLRSVYLGGPWQSTSVLCGKKAAHQSSLGLDERPVLTVDLVVKAAGVTQILSSAVTSPQRSRCRTAVDALTTFYCSNQHRTTFTYRLNRRGDTAIMGSDGTCSLIHAL